ncbi:MULTISPECIES: hypothetical protein [unclassified Microbacterium]|uniref:hypothetical protein n=1 Tax=unclassified Microbacterium TaxID=2609290 RepID=UPI00300FDAC5
MLVGASDPMYWVPAISIGLLVLLVNLLLVYLVIRLAITHGMLSYSRQLEDERSAPVFRG